VPADVAALCDVWLVFIVGSVVMRGVAPVVVLPEIPGVVDGLSIRDADVEPDAQPGRVCALPVTAVDGDPRFCRFGGNGDGWPGLGAAVLPVTWLGTPGAVGPVVELPPGAVVGPAAPLAAPPDAALPDAPPPAPPPDAPPPDPPPCAIANEPPATTMAVTSAIKLRFACMRDSQQRLILWGNAAMRLVFRNDRLIRGTYA
jgi:hypothetical protein